MGRAPSKLSIQTLNKLREILRDLEEDLYICDAPELAKLVNYSANSSDPIQRWFRYREGYSTRLIDTFLQDIPSGELVVDPFCGGGATLIGANRNDYRSIGIEVNPLSVFVSKVRTRTYYLDQLKSFECTLKKFITLKPDDPASPKPKLSIIDKVFLPEVLRSLLVIKHFIDTSLAREEHDFFFLAWLSILEEVSNVYKEGNGIKYRNRKRTPSGYIDIPINVWQQSIFPEDKFEHVVNVFF